MLGPLDHVAIAVPDLEAALATWRDRLGATVSDSLSLPEHGVTVVFIRQGETAIELLEPLGTDSPISGFLQRNPDGGIHHLCFLTGDLEATRDHLLASGARVLGNGIPRIGAHDKPVLFLHPKDFQGTLIELQQC